MLLLELQPARNVWRENMLLLVGRSPRRPAQIVSPGNTRQHLEQQHAAHVHVENILQRQVLIPKRFVKLVQKVRFLPMVQRHVIIVLEYQISVPIVEHASQNRMAASAITVGVATHATNATHSGTIRTVGAINVPMVTK
jgi:hypothetical protein